MTWQSILAALKSGTWATAVGGVVALAATVGLITATQESTIQTVLTAVVGLIAAVTAVVHTFSKAKAIRAATTAK